MAADTIINCRKRKSGDMLAGSTTEIGIQETRFIDSEVGRRSLSQIFVRKGNGLALSQIRTRKAVVKTQLLWTATKSIRRVRGPKYPHSVRFDVITAARSVGVISLLDSDIEDEVPQARPYPWDSTCWNLQPPSALRQPTPRVNSCWAPPAKGFLPPFTPRIRAPTVVPISQAPLPSSTALDACGRPYPSPYTTYIPGCTILDYDVAKAKARTPLVPIELRTEAEKYHSVLEHDLAVTSDRLAHANQKLVEADLELTEAKEMLAEANRTRASTDHTLRVQAQLLLRNRKAVVRLETEADEWVQAHNARMKEIKDFCLENLKAGTELHMDLFDILK